MPKSIPGIRKLKEKGKKIVCLTSYDFPTARMASEAGVDLILVGDTYGMVCLGMPNTLGVKLTDMIRGTEAARKGAPETVLITDMPFLTFQLSEAQTLRQAGLCLQAGAQGVKIEGRGFTDTLVARMVKTGIPVMGHLGLLPQSVNQLGGYGKQAKTAEGAKQLMEDARFLQDSGVFAVVLENVPEDVADRVTQNLSIPTIGIGAGAGCDGQILVIHDLLGLTERPPPFVRPYTNLHEQGLAAIKKYGQDVREGKFPEAKS